MREDSQGVRRTGQEGESSGARVDAVILNLSDDEFDYLPAKVIEQDRLTYELWQQQLAQDRKYQNEAMRLDTKEANIETPLSSQASSLMQIEKDKLTEKNKDQVWCTEKINLRKLRWWIISVSLKVERATKKKSAKVLITVERSNHHNVSHLVKQTRDIRIL